MNESDRMIEIAERADDEEVFFFTDIEGVNHDFTFKELNGAFDRVKDPEDWKEPISAIVKLEAVAVTLAAIEFFTATRGTVHHLPLSSRSFASHRIVESIGYRRGPAGDH